MLINQIFETVLEIFNGAKVMRLWRPVSNIDVVVIEELGGQI